jgi:hypothetical protein
MSDSKPPGLTIQDAVEAAKGATVARLDCDWLAVDRDGHVAFFRGNDHGPIPVTADRERVSEALEVIARAAAVLAAATTSEPDAYRGAAQRAQDPIFDTPAQHERPFEGYPLLVVGSDPVLREVAAEWSARDMLTREGFGVVFSVIGSISYDQLHDTGVCRGCRVLDDPNDPRPGSPEALATLGLYVYAHVDADRSAPYRRIAGPSVPADLSDLEPLVQQLASRVALPVSFEAVAALTPDDLTICEA